MNPGAEVYPPAATADAVRAQLLMDYGQAVIHLALNRNRDTRKRTLLFGWVELLPNEIPPPVDDYCDHWKGTRLGGSSANVVHVRHAVVSCSWALDWYLEAREGRVVWPTHAQGFARPPADADELLNAPALSEYPKWPRLVTHSEETTALPFVSGWVTCPRLHHLIAADAIDLQSLWSESEHRRGVAAVSEHMHFSFEQHPETWGSLHLVAPNPVYGAIRSRLRQREDGDSVLIRFRRRAGSSLDGLTMRLHEEAPWGPNEVRVEPIRAETMRLDFDHIVGSMREEVLDATRGVLKTGHASYAFVRSVQMDFHLARTVRVAARRPEDSFSVTRSGEAMRSLIGQPAVVGPAERRLTEAWFARRGRAQADDRARGGGQEWFRNQPREARQGLVRRIHEARRTVMIVDPYFGPDELVLVEAVGLDSVAVRVLTARNLEAVQSDKVGVWSRLLAELETRQGNLRHNSLTVRVLSEGALHDRFLVIDGAVWVLGGSCNKLGDRGSLILGVPDSKSMLGILETLWDEGRPLDELVAGETR